MFIFSTLADLFLALSMSFGAAMAEAGSPTQAPQAALQIAVISDIHLRYKANGAEGPPSLFSFAENDFHAFAMESALKHIENNAQITDLIINGDLFDGALVAKLPDEQRIQLIEDFLLYLKGRLGKTLHFNFGNHDEKWDFTMKPPVVDPSFSAEQARRLRLLAPQGIMPPGAHAPGVSGIRIVAQGARWWIVAQA